MNAFKLFRTLLPITIPLSSLQHFNVIADNNEHVKTSYNQCIYPLKPDGCEIRKFLNFLEMLYRHKKVLIIGSNPDLRDISFITDKQTTCIDTDKNKMEAMRDNMKYKKYVKNANNEQLIECDVLNMDKNELFKDKKYDLILSIDTQLNRLPFDKWNDYLSQICNHLENDGFFVLKVMNKPNIKQFEFQTPEDIVTTWIHSKYKNDVSYLFIHLLMYLYHIEEKEKYINIEQVLNFVKQRCDKYEWEWNKKQKQEFFDKYDCIYNAVDDNDNINTLYCNEQDVTQWILSEDKFYFQDTVYGNDDCDKYKFTPIYVLGKQTSRVGGIPFIFGLGEEKPTDPTVKVRW